MPKNKVIKKSALTPTILIAGGAGFIGSHLAEALLLQDARVIVLDNFKTGRDFYIGHLLNNPKFALYDVDINQGFPDEIQSVDYVIHLAGLEEYLYSEDQVNLDALLTNAVGTKNLLDFANRAKAKFLLASSIYVYQGMMSQINLDQYFGRTNFEEKKYSATEAKRYAEALVWEYYKKNDTDVRIVRLPEVYGPKMDLEASGNLGRLLSQLMDNKDLVVYGEGIDKEQYLYISDVVNGIVKALFSDKTSGKIYSLISHEPYSVLEVAFLLKTIANREIKVNFKSKERELDPRQAFPDTSNLKDLKWDIKVSFKEGIIKTLLWYGYEVNQHSFKPAKYIEDKQRERAAVDSLINPQEVSEEQISSVINFDLPEIKKKRTFFADFKNSFHLPKFKLSHKTPTQNLEKIRQQPLPQSPSYKERERPSDVKKKKRPGWVYATIAVFLALVVTAIAIPSAVAYVSLKRGVSEMQELPALLAQFNSTEAQSVANDAFVNLKRSQRFFNQLKWVFVVTGKTGEFNSANKLLSSAVYSSKSSYYFAKASIPFSSLWEVIKPTTEKTFSIDEFNQYKGEFNRARDNLQLAEAEMKNVNEQHIPAALRDDFDSYKNLLTSANMNMDLFSSSVSEIPDLLGVNEPKSYMILFENNNEIRATGGFIGSYALLELEKGKIKTLNIDDVYNPDGQLKLKEIETPEAPEPIKEYLEEENLFIRNANWNPSFPQSAILIQDLYAKASGIETDGVIALNLDFAEELLRVTGPIYLTAYNEEISADNLYERAQFHSEFKYEDGSDQKRSFLTVLGSKLLEKMFSLPPEKMQDFWSAIYTGFDQKDLMIYLNNSPFEATLKSQHWDGDLVDTDKDYLYVVDSNLGGNKADYFVNKSMNYLVTSETRDGLLRGILTLDYNHTAQDDSWPSGVYKNYIRIITQEGSKLTGATIKYSDKEEVDVFEDMVISSVEGLPSYEYAISLDPQKSVQLTITYDLPQSLSVASDSMNYGLYWQKQSGTQKDFEFKFNAPFGLKSSNSEWKGVMKTDQQMYVMLDPK